MHNNNFSYRPDIDGLRALAVLAVVIYHFNKQWLPGGFVGVDIFFVISGYLITGIIYSKGTNFSFADFYGRRVRRILPAAIFVTAVTLIAGSFLLMPVDVKALSGSAIASALSGANIYYWLFLDTSYFAASSDTVPLLHMWSLGVEEQFYLIWPALMIIAMRLGGKRLLVGAAVLIAAASFAVSEYYVSRDPSFAYYMLPSRAGELLVGALLFLWQDSRRTLTTGAANVAGAVGLLMVGYSLALLSETGGFPGIRSIIPAVGTALLIASGINQGSVLARALTNPLFRYIGLRSFSLYLWHWPVLAFYRYAYGEPSLVGGLACAIIMLGADGTVLPDDRNPFPLSHATLAYNESGADLRFKCCCGSDGLRADPKQRPVANSLKQGLSGAAQSARLQHEGSEQVPIQLSDVQERSYAMGSSTLRHWGQVQTR